MTVPSEGDPRVAFVVSEARTRIGEQKVMISLKKI